MNPCHRTGDVTTTSRIPIAILETETLSEKEDATPLKGVAGAVLVAKGTGLEA
jgi:hypothetical protein